MTRSLRILAFGVALAFVAAACGGGTGEGQASASVAPTVAATAAPTQAPVAKFLILQGDTVRSPEGLTDEEKTYLSCTQQSRFPQGSRIVWRFRALDQLTGKQLDDKQIKSFVLTLPDGKAQNLKYGPHPATNPVDYFWTTGFSVPKDYPTGAFNYKLVATSNEGAEGVWDQFKVAPAMLQIVAAGKR